VAEVNWTDEAERWLRDIFEYIAAENPFAALQVVSGLTERTHLLHDFPEAGYRYDASERHVRVLLFGHYRIAYLIKDDGNIDILGVFHGALDIDRYSL
jgi:toxin ParE1/3/4